VTRVPFGALRVLDLADRLGDTGRPRPHFLELLVWQVREFLRQRGRLLRQPELVERRRLCGSLLVPHITIASASWIALGADILWRLFQDLAEPAQGLDADRVREVNRLVAEFGSAAR
jgi:hypothetical protein